MRLLGAGATAVAPAVVAVTVAAVLLIGLGRPQLFEPDEARHAEIAREMLVSGRFLTPHLEGEPYYDKPVLFHWLVAASIAAFGHAGGPARIPSALAALWTILVAACWSRRAYGAPAGALAALGLATTPLFVALGRFVNLDMVFTAALTSALAWLGHWTLDARGARRSIYPFYIALGVACLVKGPAAYVLGGLVGGAVWLADRRRFAFAELKPVRGVLLAVAVAAPWYLAAWRSNPAYIETFLFQHNLGRYLVAGAVTSHQNGWLYYLWAAPLALLPWVTLMPWGLPWSYARARSAQAADRFNLVWATVVVVFFSLSRTRTVVYLAPALPPLVAVTAGYAARTLRTEAWLPRTWQAIALTLVIVCGALGVGVTGYGLLGQAGAGAGSLLGLLPAAVAALAVRAWIGGERSGTAMLAATAAAMAAVTAIAYGPVTTYLRASNSLEEPAAMLAAELPAGGDVAQYGASAHSLAFYSNRIVREASSVDDAVRILRSSAPAALITRRKHLDDLGLDPLPDDIELRWQNTRGRVLLVNRGYTQAARIDH